VNGDRLPFVPRGLVPPALHRSKRRTHERLLSPHHLDVRDRAVREDHDLENHGSGPSASPRLLRVGGDGVRARGNRCDRILGEGDGTADLAAERATLGNAPFEARGIALPSFTVHRDTLVLAWLRFLRRVLGHSLWCDHLLRRRGLVEVADLLLRT